MTCFVPFYLPVNNCVYILTFYIKFGSTFHFLQYSSIRQRFSYKLIIYFLMSKLLGRYSTLVAGILSIYLYIRVSIYLYSDISKTLYLLKNTMKRSQQPINKCLCYISPFRLLFISNKFYEK